MAASIGSGDAVTSMRSDALGIAAGGAAGRRFIRGSFADAVFGTGLNRSIVGAGRCGAGTAPRSVLRRSTAATVEAGGWFAGGSGPSNVAVGDSFAAGGVAGAVAAERGCGAAGPGPNHALMVQMAATEMIN